MKRYILSHLSDDALLRDLASVVARDRTVTAEVLAHIAEVDERRLYRPAGFPSMFAFCVGRLHMSEDVAYKHIKAARAARRFPAIFEAVATGRLHLSAVVMLAPHLTEDTAEDLLAAAVHLTKAEIERLLAERFPQPDVLAWVQAISPASSPDQQAPGPVQVPIVTPPVGDRPRVKPLAPQRFAVQFTMDQSAHDKLRYVQDLLGHEVPSGDLAQVIECALDALIPQLEKRRFSATVRPRPRPGRRSENPRHIPAHVQRAVWQRDHGQCTFVSDDGHRCQERKFVEIDHVQEVARGGESTLDNLRLRCHAHNQYAAECTFGPEFMRHKRIAASEVAAGRSGLQRST